MPIDLPSPTRRQLADWARLTQKKYRRERRQFLIEGELCVREALQARIPVEALVILNSEVGRFEDMLHHRRFPAYRLAAAEFPRISTAEASQGIVAVAKQFELPAREGRLAMACEQVSDPGNGGALIRVADFFGATELYLGENSVEVWNPKVVRGSMGSLFHQPVRMELGLREVISNWRGSTVAVAAHGGKSLRNSIKLKSPVLLVLGHETRGLSEELAALCQFRLTLEAMGPAESLNLVTAAAVFAYAVSQNGLR